MPITNNQRLRREKRTVKISTKILIFICFIGAFALGYGVIDFILYIARGSYNLKAWSLSMSMIIIGPALVLLSVKALLKVNRG